MNKKSLIIYHSWSGNTESVAELIQKNVKHADLFILTPLSNYPDDYKACVDQAKAEIQNKFTPQLKTSPKSLDPYDVIFIGSPIWWYTMSPPVFSFLKQTDLAEKTIVLFCTHGGGGKSNYIKDLKSLADKSLILEELVLFKDGGNSAEKEIKEWLSQIKF